MLASQSDVINIPKGQYFVFSYEMDNKDFVEIYYVDPSDRDHYIALDEYFGYLKEVRVNELQKIAQDLGARHFRVTYKEEKTSFSKKSAKGNLNLKAIAGNAKADAEQQAEEHAALTIGIEGHEDFRKRNCDQ